jgi:CPA1 family monovalent cation:H+ antiporter
MLGAVLLSNLISQQFPRVSTPLVQIGIGVALTLLPINLEVTLDPELFFVLFIAPLLFEDAKKADKPALWRLKRPILLLALGLVFATTLAAGFFIHWSTGVIPLAAAFALAAALAPTDAVAVGSLRETATISDEQDHLLKGESLLNDASSVVAFRFAIGAVLTGTYSLINVSLNFLFMFFGGLVLGVILMALRAVLVRWLRASGIESITFHVLFEVITPFLVFLIAEAVHVSGIIAVVAAGIAYSFSPRQQTPRAARHNIVSTSAWSVISYSLNGLIFLILGTQLPYVIQRVWSTSPAAGSRLILFIVIILLVILVLRFFWVLVMHRKVDLVAEGVSEQRYWPLHLRDALVLSLTGAKGAITLAVVLTIPLTLSDGTPFPERDLIIFLASGVILLSLLLANFLVPLVAPKKAEKVRPEREIAAILEIYRLVIQRLVDDMKPNQKAATEEVAQQYYLRISTLKASNQLVNKQDADVRRRIIGWERDYTRELVSQGRVSALAGIIYLDQLSRTLARVQHHNAIGWELTAFFEQLTSRFKEMRRHRREHRKLEGDEKRSRREIRSELRELAVENYLHVQKKLQDYAGEPDAPIEAIELINNEFERRVARLKSPRSFLAGARGGSEDYFFEVEARALEFEREAISDALHDKRISRATAKRMRDNVAMMELDIEEQLE